MNTKYEQQMKKGVLELLVLRLLVDEEKYGYQLITELKEKSNGLFDLKEGTLYPILYRLEDEKLVVSKWLQPPSSSSSGKSVPRKYYEITPEGLEAENKLEALWKHFTLQVTNVLE